ncbi:MAG: ATP-binding protein [Bacteroidota bacterium]
MSDDILLNLYRLDVQTNRKGTEGEPSSGLGLIMGKESVEKHGGKLRVESQEGNGSVFCFTFPVIHKT